MNRSISAAFALIFALVLAAPAAAQRDRDRDWDSDRGPRETETVDRTLTMQPGGTLKLNTFSGKVRITGAAGNQVVVHAVRRATRERLNDIKLEVTQTGNRVEIDVNHRLVERRNDNVVDTDLEITVPTQTALELKTFSAPITVIGVNGRQNIDGFSSGITIEAREWTDGNDLDIHTFSGEINLRLPDSARGDIDFNSFSGEFQSDLPVTLTTSSRRNFRGVLNGGGNTDLRLKTFSGDVNVRR
jgi:DUF4097 and DUF4098 domain-containing protein YvlB